MVFPRIVSTNQIRGVVEYIDLNISENELQCYVNWVCQFDKIFLTSKNENIQPSKQRELGDF